MPSHDGFHPSGSVHLCHVYGYHGSVICYLSSIIYLSIYHVPIQPSIHLHLYYLHIYHPPIHPSISFSIYIPTYLSIYHLSHSGFQSRMILLLIGQLPTSGDIFDCHPYLCAGVPLLSCRRSPGMLLGTPKMHRKAHRRESPCAKCPLCGG